MYSTTVELGFCAENDTIDSSCKVINSGRDKLSEHFIACKYKRCCPPNTTLDNKKGGLNVEGPKHEGGLNIERPKRKGASIQRGPNKRRGASAEASLNYVVRMGRVAVFVDAGYFFAQGSKELFGENLPRGDVKLDALAVSAELKNFAEDNAELDLLRIYWYDGATGKPTQQHIELAELPNVKMRLGFVNSFRQQKGVDSLIVTDMVTLAQNKAMVSCVLLAGDEDLRVGVQLTQEQGVRVHLLGIRPAKESQSNLLRQEADTTHEWNSTDIEPFLSKVQGFSKKLFNNINSLNGVGTKVANLVPENKISEILSNLGRNQHIPEEYFRQLMRGGRSVTMKGILDEDQKTEVLDAFISHLKDIKANKS